ncbi:MAG: class I SAM-dependent methyltransferase [Candidatus Lutacidiplasmatales archaeon]
MAVATLHEMPPFLSGQEHLYLVRPQGSVPLGFVSEGQAVFLVARERSARWPVEVLRDGMAVLRADGLAERGSVSLVTDPVERDRVLEKFFSKYGPERFHRWYEHPARVLRVDLGVEAGAVAGPDHYYGWLSAEFDNVAYDYDRHITGNRINRLLRDRSLAELRRAFGRTGVLLEIGCGSGMETLPLIEDGHELLCVDISEKMLDVVRQKAVRAGVSERLRTIHLRAAALPELVRSLGSGAVDGAFSTYGALNCEEDLAPIPSALQDLIRPGGRFVAGVYNRWCLFEMVGYSLTGQIARATGRMADPVPVGSSRFCVDVFAHSVGDFDRLFGATFSLERLAAVPVILPPSDLVGYAEMFSRHFELLDRWDRALAKRWPFRALGDHFLMTMVRRERIVAASPSQ